jgi:hypothetical protein
MCMDAEAYVRFVSLQHSLYNHSRILSCILLRMMQKLCLLQQPLPGQLSLANSSIVLLKSMLNFNCAF